MNKKITISFVGHKGGSGKTSGSHLMARGCGMSGLSTYLLNTDNRKLLSSLGRWYRVTDADSIDKLNARLDMLRALQLGEDDPPLVAIMDSYAGRNDQQVGEELAIRSHVVVIPFMNGGDDVRVGLEVYHYVTAARAKYGLEGNVFMLPSRWPSNPYAAAEAMKRARHVLAAIPEDAFITPIVDRSEVAALTFDAADGVFQRRRMTEVNLLANRLFDDIFTRANLLDGKHYWWKKS